MLDSKYILFNLGTQKFCMNLSKINVIERFLTITPVPITISCIVGVVNLRENIIPIYSLKEKFNIPNDLTNKECQYIIANTYDVEIGIEVDEVLEIVSVTDEDVHPVPDIIRTKDTECFESIVKIANEVVICISVDGIMSKQEALTVRETLIKEQE